MGVFWFCFFFFGGVWFCVFLFFVVWFLFVWFDFGFFLALCKNGQEDHSTAVLVEGSAEVLQEFVYSETVSHLLSEATVLYFLIISCSYYLPVVQQNVRNLELYLMQKRNILHELRDDHIWPHHCSAL